MRWCLSFAVILGLSFADAVSHAQQHGPARQGEAERLTGQRPSSEYPQHSDAGYFAKSGVVRFLLIQGRLQLDSPRHRKGSQSFDQDGVYESITVTAQRGIPSVHYVCQTSNQHLTLSVANATDLRIESFFPLTGERAVLEQPGVGKITWSTSRGKLQSEFQGDTLLHVHRADPIGFSLHCGALSKRVLRGKSLGEIENATKHAMIQQLANGDFQPMSCADVLECVERLGAKKRAVRVAASKRLLQWGTPVLPILRSIDENALTYEQRNRMTKLIAQLRNTENDTPRSLATMLRNDQRHWQSIAHELSSDQIRLANHYLHQVGLKELPSSARPIEQIASGDRLTR
jgi:hypothetical protein